MRESLTKPERLTKKDDFKKVFSSGKSLKADECKFFYRANGLGLNRLGITFPRKFGLAVERNRMKRMGRYSFRTGKKFLNTGYDCLFVFYRFDNLYQNINQSICSLLKQAGVWKS